MKRTLTRVFCVLIVLALQLPLLLAQIPNENLANAVLAARKKEAAQLQQYTWNSRTEMVQDGQTQDIRIDSVTLGADGKIVRTLINDQPGQLPGGFLRRAIEENKRKELEQYVSKLGKLIDQYTLPTPGKVIDFMATAKIQPLAAPDGKSTLLQITGNNVVVPGDTFTMTLDGSTFQPKNLQITTTSGGDQVTVSAVFKASKAAPNHVQFATAQIADKNLTVLVHNYDYVPND